MSAPSDRHSARILEGLVLLATAGAAFEFVQRKQDRKAGIDPSTQEDEKTVLRFLTTASTELRNLFVQVRVNRVAAEEEFSDEVEQIRGFHSLMQVTRAERILALLHQRLLSLYPAVPPELVEDVRLLRSSAAVIIESPGEFHSSAHDFADSGFRLLEALKQIH